MSKNVRPAATDTDKAIFNQLLEDMSAVDTYFCCGGTLELINRPLTLFYKAGDNNHRLDFRRLFEQSAAEHQGAINQLLQACVPAPHGRGDETVLDESYRLARELRQDEFALSIELLSEIGSGILSSINALIAGRSILSEGQRKKDGDLGVPNLMIIPRLYKLNAYTQGGFFKAHRDTPKGNDHVGTLMIALPTAHQGGILSVRHGGREISFDWGLQCSQGVQTSPKGRLKIYLPWAFLFSDVEHEVLPVQFGTRVTIAYDIFCSQVGVMNVVPPVSDMDGTAIPLYNNLLRALRNPSFLTKGAKVAIALSHSYPLVRGQIELTHEEFAAGIKGVDAIMYRALKAAGLDVSLRAVMMKEVRKRRARSRIPKDGYGPETDDHGDTTAILVTANTFKSSSDNDFLIDEEDYEEAVEDYFGAKESPELMWVKKPSEDTFMNAGAYLTFSNEHSLDFFYAAAAFILDVPPYGKGSRVFL